MRIRRRNSAPGMIVPFPPNPAISTGTDRLLQSVPFLLVEPGSYQCGW
jgi:hypothetical protein